jgi:hypothetical protein
VEYVLGALVVFLALLIVFQERRHVAERIAIMDRHYAEREALLNRLMARSLTEYVQADLAARYQPQDQTVRQYEGEDYAVGL